MRFSFYSGLVIAAITAENCARAISIQLSSDADLMTKAETLAASRLNNTKAPCHQESGTDIHVPEGAEVEYLKPKLHICPKAIKDAEAVKVMQQDLAKDSMYDCPMRETSAVDQRLAKITFG